MAFESDVMLAQIWVKGMTLHEHTTSAVTVWGCCVHKASWCTFKSVSAYVVGLIHECIRYCLVRLCAMLLFIVGLMNSLDRYLIYTCHSLCGNSSVWEFIRYDIVDVLSSHMPECMAARFVGFTAGAHALHKHDGKRATPCLLHGEC